MQNIPVPGLLSLLVVLTAIAISARTAKTDSHLQTDVLQTSSGELRITPIHHASLILELDGKVIHVDPVSQGDYAGLPQADLILITDVHPDHQVTCPRLLVHFLC